MSHNLKNHFQKELNVPIYHAMNALRSNIPTSIEAAQKFLNTLSPLVQEQLVAAIYLGREHIHSKELRNDPDIELSRAYTDHIGQDEYANILYEKGGNSVTYLDSLEKCARASGFDLNQL